jgi:hypothetical protein
VASEAEAELELTATLSPLSPSLYLIEDFSREPAGWELAGAWERGLPSGRGDEPEAESGPCIGTAMGETYPVDMAFSDDYAQTPALELADASAPVLQYQAWLDAATYEDGGHIEVATDPDGPWTVVPDAAVTPEYDGSAGGEPVWWSSRNRWMDYEVSLTEWAGQTVWVRFAIYAGSWDWTDGAGWYVDDVLVLDP